MFSIIQERIKLENKLSYMSIYDILNFYNTSKGRKKKSGKKIYDSKIFEIKNHCKLVLKICNEDYYIDIIDEIKNIKDEIKNDLDIINPIIQKLEELNLEAYNDILEVDNNFNYCKKKYNEILKKINILNKLRRETILKKELEDDSSTDDDCY